MSTTRKQRSSARTIMRTSEASFASEDSFGSQSLLESSRVQEKEQLTGLNSRLATYIDKVRQLEAENNRLTVQIKDIEIVEKKEKNGLADRFEAEKLRLRQALDDAREEAAKYAVERDTAQAEHERLAAKVGKLERDLKKAEDERLSALSLAESSTAKQKTIQNKLDKLESENRDLEKEIARLRAQLAALQKNLEDESVLRAAANNKVQALSEDLEFQKKQHKSALEEVRHKRQVDMTTYAKQVNDEYQSKLQDQLAEMRAHFQAQLASNKAAFEEGYKNKLNDARERAEAEHSETTRLRSRVRELEASGSNHVSLVEALRRELVDLKDQLDSTTRTYQERLSDKDSRITELNREIQRMMEEFHNLLDVKIQLDAELNAYRVMLEAEEDRLNLTGNQSQNNSMTSHHVSFSTGSGSAQRGVKRKRIEINGEESDMDYHRLSQKLNKHVDGPVGIDEVDPNGLWVRILNTTDEDISIAHWKLLVRAGGKEVTYQFNNRMKLEPHASATVYSAESGEKHRPPTDFVMKKQNWPIGENPSASLVDSEGGLRSSISFESSESTDASDPAERCSVM
uniref:Lamin n=1 Tax=Heterorhabditis bacteriophora TaxID=37862 RepID=A0A1I7XRA9_HETBA